MDDDDGDRVRVSRLERRVERLERELKDAKRKAAADLAAERRRSQYKIARVLNRKRERAAPEPSECMICDERQGNIHHCKAPRACRNVICDRCAKDARFDRRCLLCRSAGLAGLAGLEQQTPRVAPVTGASLFIFGAGGQPPSRPPDCATQ